MNYVFHLVNLIGIYAILAMSLNIAAGVTGMLSLSHAAFYGIGAYCVALVTVHVGWPVFLAIPVGVLVTGFVAACVGAASGRLRRDQFVIATFAFQILVFSLFNNLGFITGGPNGIGGIKPLAMFGSGLSVPLASSVPIMVAALATFWLAAWVEASQFGRILRVIREDEAFARSVGVNVTIFKVLAFTIAGSLAALAGGLYATYVTYIDPTSFTFAESLSILTMVIVGGLGNSSGAVVGATLFTVLPELLRAIGITGGAAANIRQVAFGACLVVMICLRPSGLFPERLAKLEERS